ncbi:MAG: HAD-IC family P-type ATPase [Clostridia bacterium]|nr:HAD-IC family P-type ATPase [Clostridia bacterium]
MKQTMQTTQIPTRYTPDPDIGLTTEEVQSRIAEGYTNYTKRPSAKPIWKILKDNVCTVFNLIWAIIIGTILVLQAYDQLFFAIVIVMNTVIAVVLEIRAKITLERLDLVTAPRVDTQRNGITRAIDSNDLVLDDVIILKAGEQVPADSILLDGIPEMNESMLTGESDAIKKKPGDMIFAGSFVISGSCRARVEHVGRDNYIQSIARKIKAVKAPQSYLFRDMTKLIRYIAFFIGPVAVLLCLNNFFQTHRVEDALLKTAGALVGMIPAGMYLLITVALSMGVIKLSRKRAQVRDTYSIEMLSRTNMLCLDKTGTITDGTMRVIEQIDLTDMPHTECGNLIASIMAAQSSQNFTSDALLAYYKVEQPLSVSYNIPFSSKRKYTATAFEGIGTCAIGAPEFLSVGNLSHDIQSKIEEYAAAGQRVLMLAQSLEETTEDALPRDMRPLALIILEDHIRPEAPDTIAWFVENNVKIKIISGDNPVTVSAIAKRVGVLDAEKFASLDGKTEEEVIKIADEYTVFGRVTPEQKLILVKQLQSLGYVVSMTGDGVNDAMALKEADCSIAMADGSSVARNISNIVLMDNNFSALPSVVCEGRQVVNNVQRSSTLFLMKTMVSVLLSLICILFTIPYPFEPASLIMVEVFVIAIPSVILTFQPNHSLIEGRFLSVVLRECVPYGLTIIINIALAMLCPMLITLSADEAHTLVMLAFTLTAFMNLVFLCRPFNPIRIGCVALSAICIAGGCLLGGNWFGVTAFTLPVAGLTLAIVLLSIPIHIGLSALYRVITNLIQKRIGAKTAS